MDYFYYATSLVHGYIMVWLTDAYFSLRTSIHPSATSDASRKDTRHFENARYPNPVEKIHEFSTRNGRKRSPGVKRIDKRKNEGQRKPKLRPIAANMAGM